MKITSISVKNWKNFLSVKADIKDRLFVVGANASGKSNLLDVFRFMRDIVKHGGGLQYAVSQRGGISKIRCLSARENPQVGITIKFQDDKDVWNYELSLGQESRGNRNTIIKKEAMEKNGTILVNRPDKEDEADIERLTQTHLEQISTNKEFREIVKFLEAIQYLHLVPQLLKFPEAFSGPDLPEDPFGKGFLKTIAKTAEPTRDKRLAKIQENLRVAVPQLHNLKYIIDDAGQPHLEVTYKHWRPRGAKQTETQLSDGTLRLIGLLWTLLEGQGLLLIEEPELSLHTAIVSKLPELFYGIQKQKKRQIIITTHSTELLSDLGISLSEILLLQPDNEGTKAEFAHERQEILDMFEGGATPAEAVMPMTQPDMSKGWIV